MNHALTGLRTEIPDFLSIKNFINRRHWFSNRSETSVRVSPTREMVFSYLFMNSLVRWHTLNTTPAIATLPQYPSPLRAVGKVTLKIFVGRRKHMATS